MEKGTDLILKERKRQIEVKGYTLDSDSHAFDECLAIAASIYAMPLINRGELIKKYPWVEEIGFIKGNSDSLNLEGRIRELSKAGALVAAEIDRLIMLNNSINYHNKEAINNNSCDIKNINNE